MILYRLYSNPAIFNHVPVLSSYAYPVAADTKRGRGESQFSIAMPSA
jgi:hypothetical protein